MKSSIKRIGILANLSKHGVIPVLQQAVEAIAGRGLSVYIDEKTVRHAQLKTSPAKNFSLSHPECDMWLVFGGDGTMLQAARSLNFSSRPVLGVNLGRLGFLTSVNPAQLCRSVDMLINGQYDLENRSLIAAAGGSLKSHFPDGLIALNDMVITRVDASRMIELRVRVNGQLLTDYRCDGLIVSTPTGSTAYSLAAGGPIVHPSSDVYTLTPICPHTLSNRSVILGLDSEIEVTCLSRVPAAMLTADGQESCELSQGNPVIITRAANPLHLIQLHGHEYFKTLREKLQWTGLHNDPATTLECQSNPGPDKSDHS